MELLGYLRVLVRGWLLLITGVLIGCAIATLVTLTTPPRYEATARAFVSTGLASNIQDLSSSNSITQQTVASYAEVAATPYVLDKVIKKLRLTRTATELATEITASSTTDTSVLDITVQDRGPSVAAGVANAIADELGEAVNTLSPTADNRSTQVRISTIQSAIVPTSPYSPRPLVYAIVGGVIGLLLAVTLVLIRHLLDTRIRDGDDLRDALDVPLMGTIHRDSTISTDPLPLVSAPRGITAESVRALRTNLSFIEPGRAGHTLVVTSSVSSEGKTTTVSNLALAMAELTPTILVDADLRRPRVAQAFGLDGSVGLTDVIIGSVALDDALQQWGATNLFILPAGHLPPNPNELLQSDSAARLISDLRKRFSNVFIDTPPLLPVSDAAVVSQSADGAIIVCAAKRVQRAQLIASGEQLRQVNVKVYGTVLTMADKRRSGYNYGSYYAADVGGSARADHESAGTADDRKADGALQSS